jgi:hypothetical protein
MPLTTPAVTSIIGVLTNFMIYWTFHPQYREQVYSSVTAVGEGLVQDVFGQGF